LMRRSTRNLKKKAIFHLKYEGMMVILWGTVKKGGS